RTEHLPSRLAGQRARLRKQRGLADAGRTLDRQQPTTVGDRVDQATHRRKLAAALEQVELDCERLLMRLRRISLGGPGSSGSLRAQPRSAAFADTPRRVAVRRSNTVDQTWGRPRREPPALAR